jgi:hypothetical protein
MASLTMKISTAKAVMLWVLSALLHRIAVKEERRAPDLRTFLLLSSPFLLMVFDLLRADDIAAAWTIAERSSFLAIAPLVVFVLRPPVDDRLPVLRPCCNYY